ncbi:hypothetical protein W02_02640 [Nitrospira sp. KM1]|uniref:hypothetical protein n=1 Tax=Nitrospira sp. KM1 TaxID=1936990 RepID=UPI0013A7AD62|nr:hypothetical protein [Nitrospira sp. KM1]BCA53124.1 hypothetical protein W02_02640 [Nitrospira sp. KM1]
MPRSGDLLGFIGREWSKLKAKGNEILASNRSMIRGYILVERLWRGADRWSVLATDSKRPDWFWS